MGNRNRPRGAQRENKNAETHGIYDRHFTDDEIDRIICALTDPAAGLSAATEATYVLLDRIIARITATTETTDTFIKLVAAHNETTGRIAHLLRSKRVITDDAANSLTTHIAAALDELAERMHITL